MTWKMISLATLLLVAFASEPNTASAQTGFFGPKNFDECVLKRMKGQNDKMLGHARAACLKEFPSPRRLVRGDEVEHQWCETSRDSIFVCVELKRDVKITEVFGAFSKEACESPNVTFGSKFVAKAPLLGKKYKFDVGPEHQFKCAQFEIWGYSQL
jgi:hypothetical protein